MNFGVMKDYKTKFEESTWLEYTLLCEELEHLKIETRLTSETPVSEMGEYTNVMWYVIGVFSLSLTLSVVHKKKWILLF